MSETLDYIPEDDGFTFPCYLAPVPRMNNPIRFRFRPTPPEERAILVQIGKDKSEMLISKKLASYMASRVVEWDIQQRVGDQLVPLPINEKELLAFAIAFVASISEYCCVGSRGWRFGSSGHED